METFVASSGYKFSAVSLNAAALGSSQYTLVVIVQDASGSVEPYAAQLERMLKTVFNACNHKDNPYREQLMMRVTQFAHNLSEIHGFKLLSNIKEDDYTGVLQLGGSTALVDATDEAVQSVTAYGHSLHKSDYTVNAIIAIITDGQDNASHIPISAIKKSIEKSKTGESLESVRTILVGVTTDDTKLDTYLQTFKDDAGIDQYVSMGAATPGKIAKLAAFISQSISSTSSVLGKNRPSQPITPTF